MSKKKIFRCQDMVETGIMEMRGYEVAQKYVRYRYKRELTRKSNTTDNGILSLLEHMNEEVNQENSNKNPVINSTQRDYMVVIIHKDNLRLMGLCFLRGHIRIGHNDNAVTLGNTACCRTIQADHAAAGLARNGIRLKAAAVVDIYNLYFFILINTSSIQQLLQPMQLLMVVPLMGQARLFSG